MPIKDYITLDLYVQRAKGAKEEFCLLENALCVVTWKMWTWTRMKKGLVSSFTHRPGEKNPTNLCFHCTEDQWVWQEVGRPFGGRVVHSNIPTTAVWETHVEHYNSVIKVLDVQAASGFHFSSQCFTTVCTPSLQHSSCAHYHNSLVNLITQILNQRCCSQWPLSFPAANRIVASVSELRKEEIKSSCAHVMAQFIKNPQLWPWNPISPSFKRVRWQNLF